MSKLAYEQMMSDRRGETLAPKYGFDNLADLAESLPTAARVLDVGAGLSSFGSDVCKLRGDIQWVNADSQYGDPGKRYIARFQDVLERAPANLHFEEANAVDMLAIFDIGQFDRVFSYWMLPHIIRSHGHGEAVTAVESMLEVARPNGSVSIGPVSRPFLSRAALENRAMTVRPETDDISRYVQAEKIVARHDKIKISRNVAALLGKKSSLPDLELPSLAD